MCRVARVTEARPFSADRLPTLTEVLELGRDPAVAPGPSVPAPAVVPAAPGAPKAPEALAAAPVLDEAWVVRRVLAELEPRVEGLLEDRLREALAPALARVADGLSREVRAELAIALRDLALEAVAQAARDSSRRL